MFSLDKIKDKSCFFIQGEDVYLSDYYISKISSYLNIENEFRKSFYLNIDSEDLFIKELLNYDLFSSKKLVIAHGISRLSAKAKKELMQISTSPMEGLYIIGIEYDSLKRTAIIKELKRLWIYFDSRVPFPRDMKKWIGFFCKDEGITINNKDIDQFTDLYGNNISEVMNEIDKATIYLKSTDITNYSDKMVLDSNINNYAIWQLLDQIGRKNKKKSIEIGTLLLNKRISLQRITYGLFNFFIAIESVKEGRKEMMAGIYLNKVLSNNLSKYSSYYSNEKIKDIFFNLRKIDYLSKNSSIKENILLEEFLVNACST